MAMIVETFTIDTASFADAIERLWDIHAQLAKRHGQEFRKLDRQIEQFMDNPNGCVGVHYLGDGMLMAAPSGVLTGILREARVLGVID